MRAIDEPAHADPAPAPAEDDAIRSSDLPLGRAVEFPRRYDPGLLVALPRAPERRALGLAGDRWPHHGADLWRAWEVSWLDRRGKPQVAIAEIEVPAGSPRLVESKSLKLYLGSLNNVREANAGAVAARVRADLEAVIGAPIQVRLVAPAAFAARTADAWEGERLDDLEVECDTYTVEPRLLAAPGAIDRGVVRSASYITDLFRSRCPITAQPDWASVRVDVRGPAIDPAALLRYLISYRDHGGFHEHCVERIFTDLAAAWEPEALGVAACFTRRGGLDINPWRSTCKPRWSPPRLPRQ
ncbi:MAG: NADPH-dependent 7-cyano-7-deazaguanine reductase QueF [Nannocystaceae bacterium]